MNCGLCFAGLIHIFIAAAQAAPHRYDHVVIVVEENRAVGQIVGDLVNAPYINSLAVGGVSLGSMYAIEHPSQPNYLQLFSGSNQGVLDDELPVDFSTVPTARYPFTTGNLASELLAAGFTFAGYSEQLEAAGAVDWADYDPHTATAPGVKYRRKHNPWANWVAKVAPLPVNQLPAAVNKAFTQFPADFTQLPAVSFVVPNQDNDMHDGSRKAADTWLQTNLNAYAQWAKNHNSLLIVTWDEDDYNGTNQIATVLYGAALKTGTVTAGTWTLHNLLRTLEDMYGSVAHAGAAADAQSIIGPFAGDPVVQVKTFLQGLNGYNAARDTMLWQTAPGINNALTQELTADLDTDSAAAGNQAAQLLIRFDSLVGNAAAQVPANATVHSAKLILNTPANTTGTDYDSDDTFRCHRMIMDWSDTATWDSVAGGIAVNGTEAAVNAAFSLVPDVDGGPAIFDVTLDVRQFLAGTAVNRGWMIRPSSTGSGDGWTVRSSEASSSVASRPSLEVVYSVPMPGEYDEWAAGKALSGGNLLPESNPDHDAWINSLEYAFNLDPLRADGVAGISGGGAPQVSLVPAGTGGLLEVSFLRRKSAASGLTYAVEFSSDLNAWEGSDGLVVTPVDGEWERVTVRDSAGSAGLRRFAHVAVTLVR